MPGLVRNAIVLVALSAAALVTWLISRPPTATPVDEWRARTAPIGYYLKNAVLAGTDEAGHIYYRIFADRLEQASQEDDLVFKQVRVEYDETEYVHWTVSAERGLAPSDRAYLDLLDNVRLETVPQGGGQPTVIQTDRLRFDSEKRLATSMDPVSIARGKATISAIGFSADLQQDIIELYSDVTAVFPP